MVRLDAPGKSHPPSPSISSGNGHSRSALPAVIRRRKTVMDGQPIFRNEPSRNILSWTLLSTNEGLSRFRLPGCGEKYARQTGFTGAFAGWFRSSGPPTIRRIANNAVNNPPVNPARGFYTCSETGPARSLRHTPRFDSVFIASFMWGVNVSSGNRRIGAAGTNINCFIPSATGILRGPEIFSNLGVLPLQNIFIPRHRLRSPALP